MLLLCIVLNLGVSKLSSVQNAFVVPHTWGLRLSIVGCHEDLCHLELKVLQQSKIL